MAIAGRYYDGLSADAHAVDLDYEQRGETGALIIRPAGMDAELVRWPAEALYSVHGHADELRLGATHLPDGARVVVRGREAVARIMATLPRLHHLRQAEQGRQIRLAVTATVALLAVIAAYLQGVPLLASRVVTLVPPQWEASLGDTVVEQIESTLGEGQHMQACDPDRNSLANRAIRRFGEAALAGSGSPFTLDITVIRSDVPNAFALPGGKVFFNSALLDAAQAPDEFAGVLAHEIGHVAYRHGMEQLISTAGTGVLIGFILGDMTGLSIAAGLGATVIDARFSRDAERQADGYAALVAQKLDFRPSGLAELIDRVGQDDDFSRALALFSTHPLTAERLETLDGLSRERPEGLEPPFTPAEWAAIKAMCVPPALVDTARTGGKTKNR